MASAPAGMATAEVPIRTVDGRTAIGTLAMVVFAATVGMGATKGELITEAMMLPSPRVAVAAAGWVTTTGPGAGAGEDGGGLLLAGGVLAGGGLLFAGA